MPKHTLFFIWPKYPNHGVCPFPNTYAAFPASSTFLDFFKAAAASLLDEPTLLLASSGCPCLAARSFNNNSSLSSEDKIYSKCF